jgi:hypothetical protein
LERLNRLLSTIDDIFRTGVDIREVRLLRALKRVLDGEDSRLVAIDLKLKRQGLNNLAEKVRRDDLPGLLPYDDLTAPAELNRRRLGIAQILLGVLAEKRFEELINSIAGGKIRIEDHRPSRTDTDYRLLNGDGRPVCRFNIKFHGTLFRSARDYVGLEPQDCFALATYKIRNALRRQTEEALPYVFVVLSVLDLNAGDVGKLIPDDYVWALSLLKGKRVVEEAIADRLRTADYITTFEPILARMPEGEFRVISAEKTNRLLREKLFERVHALTVKSFTRTFRNAEVDMHFSLSTELTPVPEFFHALLQDSPQKFAVRLYRGDY